MKNKWLNRKPSALDRVNTRRLLLYIQKSYCQTIKTLTSTWYNEYGEISIPAMSFEKAAQIAYDDTKVLMERLKEQSGIHAWELFGGPMNPVLNIMPTSL